MTAHGDEQGLAGTKNEEVEIKDEPVMGQENVENENGEETTNPEDLEQEQSSIEAEQSLDNNGLVLYPVLLPAQPSYLYPNGGNKYYGPALLPSNPYQTQIITTGLNEYPYTLWNYGPQPLTIQQAYRRLEKEEEIKLQTNRQKRSSEDDQMQENGEDVLIPNSKASDNVTNSTDVLETTAKNIEEQETFDEGNAESQEGITQDTEMSTDQLKDYEHPITPEERKTKKKSKKKKPSKGTLLAAGLLGAAAGYALTNTGIKAYHNRPRPQYLASYPATPAYYPNYPPLRYPTHPPVYANHYQTRPPISPYYNYPIYRSITLNNKDANVSLKSKEINENRSPFVLISTQQKPAQRPSQFPYNQQYYYQQYHANNYGYTQKPQYIPNRFVYILKPHFNQNQLQTTKDQDQNYEFAIVY